MHRLLLAERRHCLHSSDVHWVLVAESWTGHFAEQPMQPVDAVDSSLRHTDYSWGDSDPCATESKLVALKLNRADRRRQCL